MKTGAEPITPELAMIDRAMAGNAQERPRVSVMETAARTTAADAAPEVPTIPPSATTADEIEPARGVSAADGPDDRPPSHPRRRLRRRSQVAVCIAVIAAVVFLLPSGRWLNAAHIHVRYLPTSWPTVFSRGERSSGLKEVRLAPNQPHAFGWVGVPKATYYRVRFYRDGRQVFAAYPTKPRIVLPAHWQFHGRMFRLDSGHYRWIVQPGFGTVSAKRYGTTIIIADWVAARS